MKIMTASAFALSVACAGAVHAQQSLPDSNPECMQVNGPDCVLRSATVPNRTAAPPAPITTPLPPAPVPTAPAVPTEAARPTPGIVPGAVPSAVPGAVRN